MASLAPIARVPRGTASWSATASRDSSRNLKQPDWVEAFNWVKANTPVDAYFVLDPHYMSCEGEDYHGFRGLAERGQMADWDKDPGVALLFPELAVRWSHEVHALDNWDHFTAEDFYRLREQFGVGWTVLAKPTAGISDCPYRNRSVMVCRIR